MEKKNTKWNGLPLTNIMEEADHFNI